MLRLLPAILLPIAALAVQWLLWAWISPFVWFLFFPAVFFAARLGGRLGGMISTVLSTGLVWFLFMPPQLSWKLDNPANLYSVGLFLLMGYLFSDSQERLRRALRSADAALAEARNANERIAERLRSERSGFTTQLSESEARFEATFERAAVGIVQMNADGGFLRANRKLGEMLGYTARELTEKSFVDITFEGDLAASVDQVRRLMTGEQSTFLLEKRYLRKNGGIMWGQVSASLVSKPDGTPDYVIAVIQDISGRKQDEETLRHQAEELTRRNAELERFNRITVGRELDMIALKEQVNDLSRQLGRTPPFPPRRPDGNDGPACEAQP